ncbi:MAG: ABC transporter ATP-binding protein [Fluviicola sp.]|jgi:iron complex transport system ATP-binding protein|nr:ABC transporter ATP-binding protein [Fluviicola sp.]
MIDLNEIEIGYKKRLFSIESIQLLKGKVYSLIGANGAGKTTFLRSLQGNIAPIKGQILINNTEVKFFDRVKLSQTIAFVNSKFDGVDYLRVSDYVGLGRTPYTNALGRLSEIDLKIVENSLTELNIKHLSNYFTTKLSDGERQLAAIARAISQETDIIILDEPTAFLDYANRKLVMKEMRKIATDLQKCIIISSHDLDLCIESETEILVINKKTKTLDHFIANSLSKEKLIEIGF